MEKEKLFAEFPPVSTEKWEEVIKADLKGADYDKKLIWNTAEGIKVKPYYRDEHFEKTAFALANPGTFPYTRGNSPEGNNWEIQQDIKTTSIAEANAQALEAVQKGATAICFNCCCAIKSQADMAALLKGIEFGCISLNFMACNNAPSIYAYLVAETQKRGYDAIKMNGAINFNPLGVLTTSGNWIENAENDMLLAKNMITEAKTKLPAYKVLAANGCLFREAGATIVQELAFTLSAAAEYLNKLTDLGLSPDETATRIKFNFSTGSNYFMEIAKLRAFRVLWAQMAKAYDCKEEASLKASIHCSTARWNKTLYDPYVNMLRVTTESMSAAIGGASSISVRPFDNIYKKASGFSNRIARNTQIVLKEEAYLDKVADPAAGSYYIENLTESLINEAWALFLKTENEGGYIAALTKGSIQAEIETSAKKRLTDIANRRETVLGTNQYPNFNEQMLAGIEEDVYSEKQKISANPIVKPLVKMRGSEAFEALRLKTEKSGKRPKVFMLTIGSLAMRLARSQFSSNFFAIAGFEIIDNNGFASIDEGWQTAQKAGADIVVLCSSDEEYAILAPEAFSKIGNKAILVIAGAPACQAELEAIGVKNFISMKSNVIDTLSAFQKILNIN